MYKMRRRSFLNRSTVLIGGLGLSSFPMLSQMRKDGKL